MKKIEKLIAEQEKLLPIFRQKYLDAAINGQRIDRALLHSAINDAYAVIAKRAPLLIVLQSPQQAMLAIALMKSFKEIADKDQLGGQLGGQLRGQLRDQLWDQLGDQL